MRGMSAISGKALGGVEHLKQSIIDILTTPIGTRVMRRGYGSRLFELVDKPMNRDFTLELYSAVAEALQKWERRFKLEKVKIEEVKEGKVVISLEGMLEGKLVDISGVKINAAAKHNREAKF
ncbi:MAG: GPW/gp25 family protein [Wolbachia endosymbiont of Tyrophagus putrescentiae]|nr:GPW/gp25 family protein [Wolbachia endosymbiont of Tyrophagus putrescentiae]